MLDMMDDKKQSGYWLCVSHRVGTVLTYWILTASGKIIENGSVQHVLPKELLQPEMKTRFEESDKNVRTRLDDENFFVNHHEIDLSEDTYLDNVHTIDELPSTPPDEEYGNI